MIALQNRKELYKGYSARRYNEVIAALEAQNIDFSVRFRTVEPKSSRDPNRNSPENAVSETAKLFYVYVSEKIYSQALYLIDHPAEPQA